MTSRAVWKRRGRAPSPASGMRVRAPAARLGRACKRLKKLLARRPGWPPRINTSGITPGESRPSSMRYTLEVLARPVFMPTIWPAATWQVRPRRSSGGSATGRNPRLRRLGRDFFTSLPARKPVRSNSTTALGSVSSILRAGARALRQERKDRRQQVALRVAGLLAGTEGSRGLGPASKTHLGMSA